MKKILSMLAVAAACCYGISCNNKSDDISASLVQKNLDAMHAISHSFETRDFSKLGDYIDSNAVDHSSDNGGDLKGLAAIKAAFEKEAASTDSMKSEVIKELADSEYVMSWMHYTAVWKTPMMGAKAGDKFDIKEVEVAKFKDGKAVEHWAMMDPTDVMKMMGTVPQPAMQSPAASAKKDSMPAPKKM